MPCPCCKFLTLKARGWFEICPVCGWEAAGQDDHNANEYVGGPNHVTLSAARRNFSEFGAPEARRRQRVRAPLPSGFPNS
ncbi:CPCC family cysteine-rich protein [Streptomyces sp. NPDC058257]|uniref:CPCC family cysteine-rich protein n=1 Tax=Streptomyces sp. NPDC058257 TaxID=3346409 RepID=UPI0036EB0440